MSTPQLTIFDDQRGRFGPMTDLRSAVDLRTGAVTTRRRIERVLGRQVGTVIVAEAVAPLTEMSDPSDLCAGPVLLVNSRWTGVTAPASVRDLPYDAALVQSDGQLVAAHLDRDGVQRFAAARQWQAPAKAAVQIVSELMLIDRPWQILNHLEAALLDDLGASVVPIDDGRGVRHRASDAAYALRIAPSADIAPMVVFNTTRGPIVIDEGTQVHDFVSIQGPCFVGRDCVIGTHSSLRPNTVIGPRCKVSGEVSHSIVHGHSNKAHQGFVGHTLIGQWCNLGADTSVSNLKNTYGPVRMQLAVDRTPEDTGRTFLGPLLGDYVRTGIGTRIASGSVVGTGTMLAQGGFSPKFVDRFSFLTDDGAQAYEMDRFIATARTAMGRRDVEMPAALENRLRWIARDQDLLGEPRG